MSSSPASLEGLSASSHMEVKAEEMAMQTDMDSGVTCFSPCAPQTEKAASQDSGDTVLSEGRLAALASKIDGSESTNSNYGASESSKLRKRKRDRTLYFEPLELALPAKAEEEGVYCHVRGFRCKRGLKRDKSAAAKWLTRRWCAKAGRSLSAGFWPLPTDSSGNRDSQALRRLTEGRYILYFNWSRTPARVGLRYKGSAQIPYELDPMAGILTKKVSKNSLCCSLLSGDKDKFWAFTVGRL